MTSLTSFWVAKDQADGKLRSCFCLGRAAEPLSGLTMASGFARLKSQPEVSAGYSRRMDSQWGVGCGWLLLDIFGGMAAGWWR
jgi:hypothetical protein